MDDFASKLLRDYKTKNTKCMICARTCERCRGVIILEIPSLLDQEIIVDYIRTADYQIEKAGWEIKKSFWGGTKYICPRCKESTCDAVIRNG